VLASVNETLPGFHGSLQILFIGIALGPSNLTLLGIVEELEGSH